MRKTEAVVCPKNLGDSLPLLISTEAKSSVVLTNISVCE